MSFISEVLHQHPRAKKYDALSPNVHVRLFPHGSIAWRAIDKAVTRGPPRVCRLSGWRHGACGGKWAQQSPLLLRLLQVIARTWRTRPATTLACGSTWPPPDRPGRTSCPSGICRELQHFPGWSMAPCLPSRSVSSAVQLQPVAHCGCMWLEQDTDSQGFQDVVKWNDVTAELDRWKRLSNKQPPR
jgi:hypothetical protein